MKAYVVTNTDGDFACTGVHLACYSSYELALENLKQFYVDSLTSFIKNYGEVNEGPSRLTIDSLANMSFADLEDCFVSINDAGQGASYVIIEKELDAPLVQDCQNACH